MKDPSATKQELLEQVSALKQRLEELERQESETKRMDEPLCEAATNYRSIFENSVVGIFQTSPGGRFLYANPFLARLFGFGSPKELIAHFNDIGKQHYEKPGDRDVFRGTLEAEGIIRDFETRLLKKDGTPVWASLTARSVRDNNMGGSVLYYEGTVVDISLRKQAEAALRQSERRLSNIIEFLPDATFAIDRDGHIIAWNRAIEEMTGYTAEMMLGKGNYEYAIPFYGERRPILVDILSFRDDRTAKRYSFIKKDGDTLYTESDMPCVRGRNRVLWGKASPLRDEEDNITGAIESIRDITEQKKTLDALKEREQELTTKSQTLEEVNVALKVLLTQREKDKKELEERFVSNIKQAVLPYILKMQGKGLDTRYKIFLDIITDNLNEIISPFLGTVRQMGFTPKEIEAASLIKKGKTTKEIAEFMCISPRTVDTYRDNIRKKLGLSNKKANLRSYLLSFI